MPRSCWGVALALCLTFTGSPLARAEEPQEQQPKEKLVGGSVQLGTLAGFANFRGDVVTAIGGQVGAYIRVAMVTFGAEYDYLAVGNTPDHYVENERPDRGGIDRYGLSARVDFLRLEDRFGGPNTALVLWADGAVGHQSGRWHDGRSVSRQDVGVGWGWLLEHRVRLSTRPRRLETIGWKFGWRLTTAPRYGDGPRAIAACKNEVGCNPSEDLDRYDVGLVVSSSITLDW